jgi:hypothetical protein
LPRKKKEVKKVRCKKCGVEFTVAEDSGEQLCGACRRRGFKICSFCPEVVSKEDQRSTWVEGKIICCFCLRPKLERREWGQCYCCKKYRPRGDLRSITRHCLCPSCWVIYGECYSCRSIIPKEELREGRYCEHCFSRRKDFYEGIQDAMFKPVLKFFGESGPWYGIELETDMARKKEPPTPASLGPPLKPFNVPACEVDLRSLMKKSGGAFFSKRDGSLLNGLEVVSQPHSVRAWDEQEWLKELCETVKGHGGASYNTETCGVHVHRSKEDLTDLHLSISVILFLRLQAFFEKISQRKENGYCKYAFLADPKKPGERLNGKVIYKSVKEKTGSTVIRYQALNLCNEGTVELRIFRGTLCWESILAYVHFTHQLFEFVKGRKIALGTALRLPVGELWGVLEEYLRKDPLLSNYLTVKKVGLREANVQGSLNLPKP